MSIINLLIKEKRVAGIEINSSAILIAYIRKAKRAGINKKESIPKDKLVLIEEPLPKDTISNGVIVNKDILIKALKKVWANNELKNYYAVVSIPEDTIYSRLYQFPKDINEVQLTQGVNLAIDFQFPFKKSDVYLGWENINNIHSSTEVLISSIPKKIADDYINVLNESGIDVLALESHLASISRSIELKPDETNIITKTNQDSTTFFILKNNSLIFSRTVPIAFTQQENYLTNEINKIKNFVEVDKKETINDLQFTKSLIKSEYKKYDNFPDNIELQPKWLVSIGAYIRGEIPNGEDAKISLLPVGVIEAYKYQKIKAFSGLIRNMIISISAFFLITFIATYFFIFSFNEKIVKTIINIAPASADVLEKESLVRKTNSLTSTAVSIISSSANWSILINEIKNRTINGIIISNFSAPSVKDTMSIVGISKDRDTLNKFKKSLEESNLLTGVDLPITNLEKKADIPFVISFLVKDPSLLYFK